MKPRSFQIPSILRVAFIGLETIVLGLGAINFLPGSHRITATFGVGFAVVALSLLGALLLASIALIFFDRRLALSGFIAFVLAALAGLERPHVIHNHKSSSMHAKPNKSLVAPADKLPRSLRSVSPAPPCHHI
jgi:hypothetical protein